MGGKKRKVFGVEYVNVFAFVELGNTSGRQAKRKKNGQEKMRGNRLCIEAKIME